MINQALIKQIKQIVKKTAPKSNVILYGSYARGEAREDSDVDILVLVDEDKMDRALEKKIIYSLYSIEFETGVIISPLVFSKKNWEQKHCMTPFYENIQKEGIIL